MTLKTLLAATVIATASMSAAAQAATITGLFDTGVDAMGAPLAENALDAHWLVNTTGTPVVYDHPSYLLTSDARFIAVEAGGDYATAVNTYTLTFDLTGLNPATAQLSGNFEADNYATAYLNGHQIAQDVQGTVYQNFQSLTAFSAGSADFVSGLNTLTFVVTDTGKPSALLVSGLSGTAAAVPEPATWAMMLVGFGGLGAAMRSRRKLAAA